MPFDPTTVTGLKIWVKNETGAYQESGGTFTTPATATNDPVGGWQDQSGNSFHLTANVDAARPTLQTAQLNGYAVVRFDGSNDFLEYGSATFGQPLTIFLVAKAVVNTGTYYFSTGLDASLATLFAISGGSNWYINSGTVLGNTTAADASWHIWSAKFNGASSFLRKDQAGLYSGDAGSTTANRFTLAASRVTGGSGSNWQGDVAELLIYAADVGTTDRDNIEQYLYDRYFAVAAAGHPAVKRMGGIKFGHGGPQHGTGRMGW